MDTKNTEDNKVYKILYIEDLEGKSRAQSLSDDKFEIILIEPSNNIDSIISKIIEILPDIIILDYVLNEGKYTKYCSATTIAATLRTTLISMDSQFKETPIILISNNDNIIDLYRKDYTNQDLFDYAISKEIAIKHPELFRNKAKAFYKAYEIVKNSDFDLSTILNISKNPTLIPNKFKIQVSKNGKSIYEYTRFIFENLIRSVGPIIGQDFLAARLGVSKDSKDWGELLKKLENYKYTGIFSDIYNRWWMASIYKWWEENCNDDYTLKELTAEERCQIISNKFKLMLEPIQSSISNNSNNYWTICKELKEPLDPMEGIELLFKNYSSWEEKQYISVKAYKANQKKYKDIISEIDKKYLSTIEFE